VGFLHGLYRLAASDEQIRLTVGKLAVEPGSPSVIPGRVQFTIDVRHPNRCVLETIPDVLTGLSGSHPAIRISQSSKVDPVAFDGALTELVGQTVTAMTGSSLTLVSGAMHDAHHLAGFCPTTMVFVRCKGGISHHEDEYASSEDLAVGAQALVACVLALTASQD
jgi:N-carbamoyl-L-amino-acid hydrolase